MNRPVFKTELIGKVLTYELEKEYKDQYLLTIRVDTSDDHTGMLHITDNRRTITQQEQCTKCGAVQSVDHTEGLMGKHVIVTVEIVDENIPER